MYDWLETAAVRLAVEVGDDPADYWFDEREINGSSTSPGSPLTRAATRRTPRFSATSSASPRRATPSSTCARSWSPRSETASPPR